MAYHLVTHSGGLLDPFVAPVSSFTLSVLVPSFIAALKPDSCALRSPSDQMSGVYDIQGS